MSIIFGPVRQNGYVVKDIHKALRHWTEVLGVGPWFYREHAPIEEFRYRGQASNVDVSIALANTGSLQIELIQQLNDAPSLYKDFLDAGHEGLQHLAYWPENFEAAVSSALSAGYRVGHEGRVGNPGRFVYLDTQYHPGTIIELSDKSGPKGRMFKRIAEAAASWDGSDPIRTVWPMD